MYESETLEVWDFGCTIVHILIADEEYAVCQ